MPITILLLLCTLFIFSFLLTSWLRKLAIHKNILDIPNQRSSHQIPTPRGGGMAIVFSFTLAVILLGLQKIIPADLQIALTGGGIAIAAIGYADDIYKVATKWRFFGHLCIAMWAVYWLHGFSYLDLGTWKFTLPHTGSVLAVIAIVWCINLYNFMDGIDGLAGSEGLFVAFSAALALCLAGNLDLSLLLLFLAAAIAGFTCLNWPPAKIFLGDSGSGFLGYIFAVLTLYTANTGTLPPLFWLMLLAIFVCDATFTVIYRAARGEKWYAAHREHAYQELISHGASHRQVTLGITAANVFFILPLALLSLQRPREAFWLMSGLTVILFMLWLSIKSPKFRKEQIAL